MHILAGTNDGEYSLTPPSIINYYSTRIIFHPAPLASFCFQRSLLCIRPLLIIRNCIENRTIVQDNTMPIFVAKCWCCTPCILLITMRGIVEYYEVFDRVDGYMNKCVHGPRDGLKVVI